jgi:hypothetical protein
MTCSTGWRHPSGPRITAEPCGSPRIWTSDACGSTRTSPSWPEMPPRWFQALRVRQGPLDVRVRGLHADQARDVLYRRVAFRTTRLASANCRRRRFTVARLALWSAISMTPSSRRRARLCSAIGSTTATPSSAHAATQASLVPTMPSRRLRQLWPSTASSWAPTSRSASTGLRTSDASPSPPRIAVGGRPRLVRVPSPLGEVSSTHLELRQEGAMVIATDLRSTNGTRVRLPGAAPVRLRQGESIVVTPGSLIEIGDGNVIEVQSLRRAYPSDAHLGATH